jgi:hypothetical protein
MVDFGTLTSRIASKLDDNYLNSEIEDQINISITEFQQRHFWFNEAFASITLVVGSPSLPGLPADFLFELPNGGLTINYSNARFPLKKVTPIEYDKNNRQGQGRPWMYVVRNQGIEVYFYPDLDYDLELRYIKSYPTLVNPTDTNDWLNNAERLIEYRTLADMYMDYRKDDRSFATFDARADRELSNLKRENNRRLASHSLITEDINFNNSNTGDFTHVYT